MYLYVRNIVYKNILYNIYIRIYIYSIYLYTMDYGYMVMYTTVCYNILQYTARADYASEKPLHL